MESAWPFSWGNLLTAGRPALASVIYSSTVLLVVVVSLSVWTTFHLHLRALGPPVLTIFGLVILVGSLAFSMASWITLRIVDRTRGPIAKHFSAVGLVYVLLCYGIYRVAFFPPEYVEGFDIAFRVFLFAAAYGILFNGVAVWRVRYAT